MDTGDAIFIVFHDQGHVLDFIFAVAKKQQVAGLGFIKCYPFSGSGLGGGGGRKGDAKSFQYIGGESGAVETRGGALAGIFVVNADEFFSEICYFKPHFHAAARSVIRVWAFTGACASVRIGAFAGAWVAACICGRFKGGTSAQ